MSETWYVVVVDGGGHNGECLSIFSDEQEALAACQEEVLEKISNHHRHALPLKVTPEIARTLDIRMFAASKEIELPLQQWADDLYNSYQETEAEEAMREYKRYLELKEKYGHERKRTLRALHRIEKNLRSGSPKGSRTQAALDLKKIIKDLEAE